MHERLVCEFAMLRYKKSAQTFPADVEVMSSFSRRFRWAHNFLLITGISVLQSAVKWGKAIFLLLQLQTIKKNFFCSSLGFCLGHHKNHV